MQRTRRLASRIAAVVTATGLAVSMGSAASPVAAQEGPTVVDPDLAVRTVVSGLVTPSAMAFLGPNDFLVLEKNTGNVKRVVNGAVQSVVLDLAVNNASERGLLGIALHPDFLANPGVYLYWSCGLRLRLRAVRSSRTQEQNVTPEMGPTRSFTAATPWKPCRPLRGPDRAGVRPQPAHAAVVPARRRTPARGPGRRCVAGACQPRRWRHRVRARQEAVRLGRRSGSPRPDAEPAAGPDPTHGRRPVRRTSPPTTRTSAAPSSG